MDRSFEALQHELAEVVQGLNPEQTLLHPDRPAGAWSVVEVIEHLALTYRLSCDVIDARLLKGRPPSRRPNFRETCAQIWVISLGRFPKGLPAPEIVRPRGDMFPRCDGAALAGQLREEMARMGTLLDRALESFGAGKVATHIAMGPLSVKQWRRFHCVHGRHHIAQLTRIISQTRSDARSITVAAN